MSHPASLASRLHTLALNDTLFPDLHLKCERGLPPT